MAAVLPFANQTKVTAAFCICGLGFLGLIYAVSLFSRKSITMNFYQFSDQILYIAIPLIIYCPFHIGGSFIILSPSTASESIGAEFIRLDYDVEKAAKAVEDSPLPNEYAEMLRKGF